MRPEIDADKSKLLTSMRELLESYSTRFLIEPFDPDHPKVRLHEPTFGAEEIWEALDSLLTTQVTMGAKVRRFESDFEERYGFGSSVMCNSGSSANLLAFAALANPSMADRLQPGDEIIVPALSWSTTVWPIIQQGLVPVVVDIDPATLNIDPDQVQRAVSEKTRGIMLVHVYGNPCDMSSIMAIVNQGSLQLVEDCCEALDAFYEDKPAGSFGRIGTFSFYFSHHITTLEGGMCVTSDRECAEMLRILRSHGWVRDSEDMETYVRSNPAIHPRFLFVNLGYNLRPTELQGGLGSVQLGKLRGFVDSRRDNAQYWRRELGKLEEFFEFQQETPGGTHSWFGFPMAVKESAPFSVRELTDYLNQRGIETRPIIAGNIAAHPALKLYDHRVVGDLANSDRTMRCGFTFGNHQAVGEQAREYVAERVKEFVADRGLV